METYQTLCFKTYKQAIKNENEIKLYFNESFIESKIEKGIDERNNEGFYIKYIIK